MDASERQLEDWVCANIGIVTGDPRAELVGRQITLANGMILDVLALVREEDSCDLVVIELKRHRIDGAAVSQVLTYMGLLQYSYTMVSDVVCSEDPLAPPWAANYKNVRGLLIAPEITNIAAHMLAALNHVEYRSLRFDDDGDVTWDVFRGINPTPDDATADGAWSHLDRIIRGPLSRILEAAKAEPSSVYDRLCAYRTARREALLGRTPIDIEAFFADLVEGDPEAPEVPADG